MFPIPIVVALAITFHSVLSPDLTTAVAFVESTYRCDVVSHAGAIGLMQIRPIAAADVGEPRADLLDCAVSVRIGSVYLKGLIDRYGERGGLRAYNCGPTGARRNPQCGADYAEKVLDTRDALRENWEAPWE